MSLVDWFPGTKPDRRVRNVVVVLGSVLVIPFVVVVFPLLAIVVVSTNYRNAAARLSRLPGVDSGGGVKAGVLVGVYAFTLWGLLLTIGNVSVSPGTEFGQSDTGTDRSASSDATELTDDRGGEQRVVSDEELLLLYETRVGQWGVALQSVERSGDVLSVDYDTTATTNEEIVEEISYLVGTYADIVDDGLETDRMDVTATEPDDDSERAYWYVESDWAEAYTAGELSEEELLALVLETVEIADGD